MNYTQKYFDEIFESMLEDSLQKGLISHAENFQAYIANREDISNYYVMDKSVIAQMFSAFYEDMTRVYESAKVEFAEGSDLDAIGEIVGIPRPDATCAEVKVLFTLSDSIEETVQIDEGVFLSTESGIKYETIEPIYISPGDTEAVVMARAVQPGVTGKISKHSLTIIDSPVGYNLNCDNYSSSEGGSEEYTDDEYRYLLINWTKIRLKGSLEAFENYFANLDGLNSYKLIPNWNGAGTCKVVLDPGNDFQLNKVYNELQSDVAQMPEDIVVLPPTEKLIDIHAIVNVDIDQINPYSSIEKGNIKSRILSAIKVFIDGGYTSNEEWYPGLELGEDFIPHKLAVFLDDEIPELKNISFVFPEDYVELLDEELGVSNNITIEMI